MKGRTAVIIIVLILVGLAVAACLMFGSVFTGLFQLLRGDTSGEGVELSGPAEVVEVKRGDLDDSIRVLGYVQSPTKASLAFTADAGTIAEVYVQAGDRVSPGDLIARLDAADLEEEVAAAQRDLEEAESALEEARQPASEIDLAERRLAVQQAEIGLQDAQDALAELKDVDLSDLEANVRTAAEQLESARFAYEDLLRDDLQEQLSPIEYRYAPATNKCAELSAKAAPNEEDVQLKWLVCNEAMDGTDAIARIRLNRERDALQAAYAIEQAARAWKGAQQTLDETRDGPGRLELAEAEYGIAEAEARLVQAREELNQALAGPSESDLTARELAVKRAQLALDYARDELGNASLRATISGRVTVVNVMAGDRISSRTTIAEVADFEDLRIQVDVDETQIPALEEGQRVRVTIDGLPDEVFEGSIQAIPLQGKIVSGIVMYTVAVALDDLPPGLRLGMTAEVEFILESAKDVLLLPAAAVRELPDGQAVTLMRRDPISGGLLPERRYVETGRSNGLFVEIVEGLSEGEQVEVRYDVPQSQSPF